MSDETKNLGTPQVMAEQLDYLKRESAKGRDQYDEQVERLWSVTITMLPNGESLDRAVIKAVAAKLRKQGQRIERLEGALNLYLATYADTQTHPTVQQEATMIAVARAALEG